MEFGLGDQFSKYAMDFRDIQRIQISAFRAASSIHSLIYNPPRIRVAQNVNSEIAKPENNGSAPILGILVVFGCLLAILIGCLI